MDEPVFFLQHQIESYIAYRKASGYLSETSYKPILVQFARYCKGRFPDASLLTQEMVDEWCARRGTETNNSCRTRMYAVVSLIRFLRVRGETEVLEPVFPKGERRTYIPHAFSEEELTNFFFACDSQPAAPNEPARHIERITIPVFFRLLFSSGIRTTEARLLKASDVNLDSGVVSIKSSKGPDQHFVVLHDSMLELMRIYDEAVSKLHPCRTYFFPAKDDGFYRKHWVSRCFKKLWSQYNSSSRAVAYELRHHYATSNISRWIDEGYDFYDKLLCLSKSMGHKTLESTKHYFSLTPAMASILEEKTNGDFERIVPEVNYDYSE